jgi:hypothetical protein
LRNIGKITDLAISSSGDIGAVTMSLSESDFDRVMTYGHNMLGYNLMGSTGFAFSIYINLGTTWGKRNGMYLAHWDFSESNLLDNLVEKSVVEVLIVQG